MKIATLASFAASITAFVPSKQSTTTTSLHVFETSMIISKGERWKNEDEVIADEEFIGVFDGHGGPSSGVNPHSAYLQNHLFLLAKDKIGNKTDVEAYKDALQEALIHADETLERCATRFLGSTACVVWCDKQNRFLVTGNVGDSRAVLSHRGIAVELTEDHRPNNPDEKARIERLGGFIEWHGATDSKKRPIEGFQKGIWRTNGALGVSRSIGTKQKPFVSAKADVKAHTLQEGDEFVVVASNGLWDGMTSQEVVSLIHECIADGLSKNDIPKYIIFHLEQLKRHVDNCGIVIGWIKK